MRLITVLLILFYYNINAQVDRDSLSVENIKSWYNVSKGKYDSLAFVNHHKILKESKRISNVKWEAEAYKSLAWYHGNGHVKLRELDSALYYFNQFESKILALKTIHENFTIAGHYLNKGVILTNRFGFLEEGLKAYHNGYIYTDKENINLLTYYDISISQIYKVKKNYEKSIAILKPRIKDTALLNKSYKLYLMQNLAMYYRLNNDAENSIALNKRIIEIAEKDKDDYYIWWTKNQISYDYYLLGKTKKAIDLALTVRAYYTKNKNIEALIDNSNYLGNYYYKSGNLDKAIKYKEDALEREYSIHDLPDIYGSLASLYSEKKNYEKAKFFYEKKDIINDSLRLTEQILYTKYMNIGVQFLKEKKLNSEIVDTNLLLATQNTKQEYFIKVLALFLFCLVLVYLVFYLYQKNYNKENAVNEKSMLEKQIKLRDEELEASVKVFSSSISSLSQIKEELDAGSFTDAEKVEKTSKVISDLIQTTTNVSLIRDKVSSKYPSLTLKLKEKHPDLSDRDMDYCLLTKLNLSIKETASVLNVSPGTVKVARSKLKVKMKISTAVSLKQYLNTIGE